MVLHPQMLSPLWPGCVLLVSVLLLVPRRMWAILIVTGIAAFVFYDLQHGVPIRSIGWLVLADVIEILTAALCLSYSFKGVPRLNSVKALARYSLFAVILAPAAGAFVGALAAPGKLLDQLEDELPFGSSGIPHSDAGDFGLGRQTTGRGPERTRKLFRSFRAARCVDFFWTVSLSWLSEEAARPLCFILFFRFCCGPLCDSDQQASALR